MKTKAKLTLILLISLFIASCQFNGDFGFGVKGNGNVIKKDRYITENFNAIEVGRGMDVYLTQSDKVSLIVEADENLHDIIITEVKNNTLKIFTEDNISTYKSKKVYLNITDVERIESWGGSYVYSTNIIKSEKLTIESTSGSNLELEIEADVADCESTSGADLKISGKVNKLFVEATSGSDIKAEKLISNICNADVSSGADIEVYVKEKLHASASSGGDIIYYGNPEQVTKKGGVSGSVIKK